MTCNKLLSEAIEIFRSKISSEATNIVSEGNYSELPLSGYRDGYYNAKRTQIVSTAALMYSITKNKDYLNFVKQLISKTISLQREDGYFYTDEYNINKDIGRANVQFLCIEIMNAFELINDSLSIDEKERIKEAVLKSALYVKNYISTATEVNQLVGAALLFLQCEQHFNEFGGDYNKTVDYIISTQNSFGYWKEKNEAPGFDMLYGTLLTAYLARIYELSENQAVYSCLIKSIKFIQEFIVDSGEVDMSFSKRWMPPCPLGKLFFSLAYSYCPDKKYLEYLRKSLDLADTHDGYYILRSLMVFSSINTVGEKKELIEEEKKTADLTPRISNFDGFVVYEEFDWRAVFSCGPNRISGGEMTSLFHKKYGWVIQQGVLWKNDLPMNTSMLRVTCKDGLVLSSNIDCFTTFDRKGLSVLGVLRIENEKYTTKPFHYYDVFSSVSKHHFKREYLFKQQKVCVTDTIYLGQDIQIESIFAQYPMVGGRMHSDRHVGCKEITGIYGKTKLFQVEYIKDHFFTKGDCIRRSFEIVT